MKFLKDNVFWIIILSLYFVGYLLPTDNSDKDWLNRSNMGIFTDHLTGCQYVKTGFFGDLTPRLKADGLPVCTNNPKGDPR